MSEHATLAPPITYTQAVGRIEAKISAERPLISEWGATRLLTHGYRAENALVIFHGFTNCPQQFVALATRFFDLGYNVFVPRLPHHGLADRLTRDLAKLQAQELYALADEAIDLAHGLGTNVSVTGISLGGLLAAWIARHREDVKLAVSIAPDFGVLNLPPWLNVPLMTLARALPDFYIWWDPRTKEANPESYPFAYPGFPSHAAGVLIEMAHEVRKEALVGRPAANKVLFVSIGGDPAVSNSEIARVARVWQTRAPGAVSTYEFEQSYHLPHDIITPESPRTRVDVVYPKLVELITGTLDSR